MTQCDTGHSAAMPWTAVVSVMPLFVLCCVVLCSDLHSDEATGFGVGVERGEAWGGPGNGICPFPESVFDFWGIKMEHSGAFCTLFLPRNAHATYRHSAVYAKVWCLSVCLN